MFSALTEVDRRTPFHGLHDIRLAVGGGRDYTNRNFVFRTLTDIHLLRGITLIIHGACHVGGADALADEWAGLHGIEADRYPVDAAIDGMWPSAGPRRNRRMLIASKATAVVAFPGNAGTRSLIDNAARLGLPLFQAR